MIAADLMDAEHYLLNGLFAADEIIQHQVVAEVVGLDPRFVDFAVGCFRVVVAVAAEQIHRQN